jgi:hypothetical protein
VIKIKMELKETLKLMEEQNLIIDRVMPSGKSYFIEFRKEVEQWK